MGTRKFIGCLVGVLALIFIILGTILFFGIRKGESFVNWGEQMEYNFYGNFDQNQQPLQEFVASGIQTIDIGTSHSQVRIVESKDNMIKIYMLSEKEQKSKKIAINQTGSKLSIKQNSLIGFNFNLYRNKSLIVICIPKSFSGELKAEAVQNVSVEMPLNLENIKIGSVSGDISLQEDIFAKNTIKISAVSGNLKAAKIESQENKIETVSGNQTIELCKGKTKSESVSGDIYIAQTQGELKLQSVSGDIKVEKIALANKVKVDSVSGSARLNFDEKTYVQVRFDSVSGDLSNQQKPKSALQTQICDLEVDIVSGDVTITQE